VLTARAASIHALLTLLCCVLLLSGCAGGSGADARPVGLAIEIDNGVPVALQVRSGQTFYLNQIDLRTSVTGDRDEGVAALSRAGSWASLDWRGIEMDEQEFLTLPNPDGSFRRRQFFRGAHWMNVDSTFELEQLDEDGRTIGSGVSVKTGRHDTRSGSDAFFVRRFRAIQWANDCRSRIDCSDASAFEAEALVELRHALHPDRTFTITPRTKALRLRWSLHPETAYTIPLTQVSAPPFAYGFSIDAVAVTPPRADGTYSPGSDITFRITLRDGAGARLHAPGSLPSYNEVIAGENAAGIQYYRAFFDPTTTYWRRKHRERMLMADFIGPAQNVKPIRTIIDLDQFLTADDVQVTGTLAQDAVHAELRTFPTARDLFGGAFDPQHAGWAAPVPDTWTHHIPADAPAGTYYLSVKGRRTYLGEDAPFTRTLAIPVGTTQMTHAPMTTAPCSSCHNGAAALGTVLHANDNLGTCAGCHVPLGFELEGPIYVRTHFIHSRTDRLDAPVTRCASCHLTTESIQRTSKSACLSCHSSYPQDHIRDFGPIESVYVGGGRESFQQCGAACHRSHPDSGL
jgi:predicted CXXCH cytochrome family protein